MKLLRGLIEQTGPVAPRDAACSLAFHHRLDPENAEIPVLAARAEARRIKTTSGGLRGTLADQERAELTEALAAGKSWVRKAIELGADPGKIKQAEAEIAEAGKLLGRPK